MIRFLHWFILLLCFSTLVYAYGPQVLMWLMAEKMELMDNE